MSVSIWVVLSILLGVAIGIAITLLIIRKKAPSLMLIENESKFNFDETVVELEKSVSENSWKIPAIHDLKETMHKFGYDVRKVKVFEICQPAHAYKILSQSEERVVSSLMPCRIAVYEKHDGKTYLSRMNTSIMGKMMHGVVPEVMNAASEESEVIIKKIIS